jgi:hypothetical protein
MDYTKDKELAIYVPEDEITWFIRQMVFVQNDVKQTVRNYLYLAKQNPTYLLPFQLVAKLRRMLGEEVFGEFKMWIIDQVEKHQWQENKTSRRGFISIHTMAFLEGIFPAKIEVQRSGQTETVTVKELQFICQAILFKISQNNGYALLHRNYFLAKGKKVKQDGEEVTQAKSAEHYKKYAKRAIGKNKLYQIFKILHDNDIIRCVSLGGRKPRLFCVGDSNPFKRVQSIRITPTVAMELQIKYGYDYYSDYKKLIEEEGIEMKTDMEKEIDEQGV